MIFSSIEFIFIFLPLTLLGYHSLYHFYNGFYALTFLIISSVLFYGLWNWQYVPLLLITLIINYVIVMQIQTKKNNGFFLFGVILNLFILGYFKYRNFFIENINLVSNYNFILTDLILPLGISFFLFQQIALLCDSRDKKIEVSSFLHFSSFIIFFPQLIAGPIVLYKEMIIQLNNIINNKAEIRYRFSLGLVIFVFGLCKKVIIADTLAPYANKAFENINKLTCIEAWLGALCYSLQLYFDFSGYSDMAIGLGLLFGLCLPVNFNTPFKSISMIDFWKRWHITMTRFFTNYLFSPIALLFGRYCYKKNIKGSSEFFMLLILPVMITFSLSGLWHGADWTYVIFGIINGLGLVINHIWKRSKIYKLPNVVGWLLTMITVLVSFVYFRADNLNEANLFLQKMFFNFSLVVPNWFAKYINIDIGLTANMILLPSLLSSLKLILILSFFGFLSIILPNIVMHKDKVKINWMIGFLTTSGFWVSLILMDTPQAFLYFTF